MEQRSSSGFGRGWVPMERDIGIPNDTWPDDRRPDGAPVTPPPLERRGLGGGGSPAEAAFAASHHPNPSSEEEGLYSAPRIARAFTPERQVRFLHHLATSGHVRHACAMVGVSAQAAYVCKRRDLAFARGWDAALVLARDAAEEMLAERALNGTREMIFYRGEVVGSRIRFDPRLLLAHLARLDKHHAEARDAANIAARFDEYLGEMLTGEPEFLAPLEESEPPEPTAWCPARPTREEALLAAREAALYDMPEDLADLPPEKLADLDVESLEDPDLWPRAVANAQEEASAAAAEAWDTETEAQHARLDALYNSSPSSLGEVAARSADGGAEPPLQGEGGHLAHPELVEGRVVEGAEPPLQGEGDRPQGGGGVNPEPSYETKAFQFPPKPIPLKTVSTVSTCRPSQQPNDIVFPFGSPVRSAKGRPAIAALQHNRQEPGTCFASLSRRSRPPLR